MISVSSTYTRFSHAALVWDRRFSLFGPSLNNLVLSVIHCSSSSLTLGRSAHPDDSAAHTPLSTPSTLPVSTGRARRGSAPRAPRAVAISSLPCCTASDSGDTLCLSGTFGFAPRSRSFVTMSTCSLATAWCSAVHPDTSIALSTGHPPSRSCATFSHRDSRAALVRGGAW